MLFAREALSKEPPGNAQLFPLARRDFFLKQEWTLPSSTVSKKAKQGRQTEYISVSITYQSCPSAEKSALCGRIHAALRRVALTCSVRAGTLFKGARLQSETALMQMLYQFRNGLAVRRARAWVCLQQALPGDFGFVLALEVIVQHNALVKHGVFKVGLQG